MATSTKKQHSISEDELSTLHDLIANSQLQISYIIQKLKSNALEYNSYKKGEMIFETLDKALKIIESYTDKRIL